jgi:class 3 adenylate cyclase/tetratricopeptide (TPR) repeat protein
MTNLLQILAAYVPPSIVHATLSAASPALPAEAKADRFPAAVLFADVSGFTPLTEALAQKGSEGPEELTRLLNGYFSRMIALVEAEGGEVVKFSGDAMTVVFPAVGEELGVVTRRAWQAAEAMQSAMNEFATLETSVGPVALGMKIGIGAGEVVAARVGGVRDRWEYVIAGDPLRQVAQAEHQARRGEIVLSPEAEAIIAPQPLAPRPLPQPDWARVQNPEAVEAALRAYVPSVVIAWLGEELQDWLAVLRPMSVLFIGVTGIDYAQPNVVERLHGFLHATREIIDRYEGSINKLAVDDKGTILLVLFGAPPRAHEDDAERALRCALDLGAMAEGQGLELAIGVTTGRVFAGPVGGETRHEYTVMGDTVNLAARLMGVAGEGQVRCDYETYRNAHGRLAFDSLAPVRVKGKAGLIRIYRPTGEAGRVGEAEAGGLLVGRQAEVTRLAAGLDEVQAGGSRILLIEGGAGIGKSRLVEELTRLMRERGIAGLLGMGRSIEQQTPYRAWRDIFSSYFDLEEVDDPAERRRRVQDQVRDVAPELVERTPLLDDVLNLGLPENALTASLDTHLRHESLVSLLLALLRAWAVERPLVLVLEDAHWLDSLSWDLTLQVARALTVARVPLLLAVVMRPLEGEVTRSEPGALAGMDETECLLLDSLSPEETLALAAARLGVSDGGLPKAVAELVQERAGGNPFFAEELVYALRDNGLITVKTEDGQTRCLVSGDLDRAAQALPDTIQGIVLSRIDRLRPEEQLTLKVAAVIGRTFVYTTLHDTLGEHMEISHRLLKGYLDDLAHLDLTPLEAPEPELTYIFKHIITQEVAYETLLFAQRRQLHRTVALWYERTFGDGAARPGDEGPESPLAPYYPLLVYHWHQAEDRKRERYYAVLAGKWAAAQFANVEAAGYFSRALELTPETDSAARYDLLLAREAVNDLRGEREAQAQDLAALDALAQELNDHRRGAEVASRQANYYEATSDYGAALEAVQKAIEHATRTQELADDAECYIAWGTVLERQGDYEAARAPLERALDLARTTQNRHAEAQSLYRLGHVRLCQGNYPAAQEHYQQALEIYRVDGHRQGEANSLSMLGAIHSELGDYPVARDYYERALSIYRTIGDRRGETITLGNLGVVYCDLGDYEAARDDHRQALDIRLTIGDRWGEAISLVNLGLVYHSLGDNETARKHCERALAIQREIGDRRGQGYSLTYLGHALTGLGELEAAAEAYDEAINIRRELGQYSLLIDDWAGLARVAEAQGNAKEALERVEDILSWIEVNGTEGIEYPFQVYLICYRILQATAGGDPSATERAHAVLSTVHAALLERAAGISDEALRVKFLENVKANQEIMAAWEARETSA